MPETLFNKVAGIRPKACNFIIKRPWHRCYPVNFAKFLRIPFLQDTSWLLLLEAEFVSSSLTQCELIINSEKSV